MNNSILNAVEKKPAAAEGREIARKEIAAKWDKILEQEVSALKKKNEVIGKVVSKKRS